jgi:thiol-disulfide isomerase/thioredoxin
MTRVPFLPHRWLVTTMLMLLLPALLARGAAAADAVQVFEPDSMARIVAAHAGKRFVVMVWSLDCEYCAASFATLAKAKREKRIEVVTIATDRADDPDSVTAIRAKLAASRLSGETWAFGDAPPERLRRAIDARWRGEMPRSYWYGADGAAQAHSGVINAAVVERMMPR